MKNNLSLMTYTFATVAGICFVSGVFILTGEKVISNGL